MNLFDRPHSQQRVKRTSYLSIGALALAIALTAVVGTGVAVAKGTKGSSNPAALVTPAAKKLGTLLDALTPYPQAAFLAKNGKTWTGWEVQLNTEEAKLLHLHIKHVAISSTGALAGIASGRYQISGNDWTVTPAREKMVNFVTDLDTGTQFYAAKGSKLKNISLHNVCGHSVGVKKGTIEATKALDRQKKCSKEGKPTLTVQIYPNESSVTLAVLSHRAQLGFTGATPVHYLVKTEPTKFQLAGSDFTRLTIGTLVSKKYPGLAKAMAAAVNQLIKNGWYKKLLEKWRVTTGSIRHSVVKG